MFQFCVVGSLNMDLVSSISRFPKPGETVLGKSFQTFFGGKGANQAVALTKLGGIVNMVGCLGNDIFGKEYLDIMNSYSMKIDGVTMVDDISTGTASIYVDDNGENNIVIVSGANNTVSIEYIDSRKSLIQKSEILLLQLEIPMDSVIKAAKIANEAGQIVILDPAPAMTVPDELFDYLDIITPNETEAEVLTGIIVTDSNGAKSAGEVLVNRGANVAIIKAGKQGAYLISEDGCQLIPGFEVAAIDTTAAGDSFNAGLAYGLSMGKSLQDAVLFANAVAAIATTKLGAQSAMPKIKEVEKLMNTRKTI